MGANIGTTITAQITAFNLSAYAPLILFVGAIMYLFFKKNMVRHVGCVIMGFGMLFFGVGIMKSAIAPLAQTESFITFISALENPFVTVLFGVAFTALLQSSSSSTVIFQAFAVEGIISYHIAAYLCIGAAIGSVTPNILASLTANRDGKRTALLNLLFNVFRAVILMTVLAIFPGILDSIQALSPGNVARQIANTHTIFAIFAVAVMLPFTELIVKLTRKLLPLKEEETRKMEDRKLLYMSQTGSIPTAVAMKQAHREIIRMGMIARDNLNIALECFFQKKPELIPIVGEMEETVNYLERAILGKLVELRTSDMSPRDLNRVYRMTMVVSDIERISDHAENVVEYAAQIQAGKAVISPKGMNELRTLAEQTVDSLNICLDIFESEDYRRLPLAIECENLVDTTQREIVQNHVKRLMSTACDPMGGVIFTDLVTDLERCSDHAINIAEALAENDYE